jgi:uncharacterized protein (DUF4415 family)
VTNIRFEWDEAKNRSNQRKHGVSFEITTRVFADPFALAEQDRVEAAKCAGRRSARWAVSPCWSWLTPSEIGMKPGGRSKWSALSRPGRRSVGKGDAMKKAKIVRHTLETLPPLTVRQRAQLKALAAKPDRAINLSDIPPLTDAQLRSAVRGRFYKPLKRQITARVDADVLEWLKSRGKGYQSRLNAILRREMLSSLK